MYVTTKSAKLFIAAGWSAMALLALPASAEQDCLKTAWANLTKGDYVHAVEAADECIDQFSVRALRDQNSLQASGEKLPPTGAVDSPADRKKIFDRWAVNDVSTAYFVKAQAAERIFRKQGTAKYKACSPIGDSKVPTSLVQYRAPPVGWSVRRFAGGVQAA